MTLANAVKKVQHISKINELFYQISKKFVSLFKLYLN